MPPAQENADGFTYEAFGLNISSCLPLRGLRPGEGEPDVQVRWGTVPDALEDAQGRGACYQAAPGKFLLSLHGVARYLASDGSQVVIDRAPQATDDDVSAFLLSSVMGAVLHQRGVLALHASAVERDGRATLLLGHSCSGKSTLAAAMLRRGHRLLADDLCAVAVTADGPAQVLPEQTHLELWQRTIEKLGETHAGLRRVRPALEKFLFPAGQAVCDEPAAVGRAYVLGFSNAAETELEPLKGMARVNAAMANTYHPRFVEGLGGKGPHFQQCAAVASQVPVTRLTQPNDGFVVEQTVDLLEEDLAR